eukprot:06223_6
MVRFGESSFWTRHLRYRYMLLKRHSPAILYYQLTIPNKRHPQKLLKHYLNYLLYTLAVLYLQNRIHPYKGRQINFLELSAKKMAIAFS